MSSAAEAFVETQQYHLFQEFCDACRRDRYIGLCYGPPGVGKTLSARHYAKSDKMKHYRPYRGADATALAALRCDTVVYTAPVATTPSQIAAAIAALRRGLREPHLALIRLEEEPRLGAAEKRLEELRTAPRNTQLFAYHDGAAVWAANDAIRKIRTRLTARERAVKDPTTLLIIDEADRLKMASLEQIRDIFDHGDIGLVLIGMPGIEKRLARYPQLYSRVGFVHQFQPLAPAEVRRLLEQHWRPPGVLLPDDGLADEETLATIIRITGGNFRLLHRLLTQIARVLEINRLDRITIPAVEAARESLVIGTT